MPRNKKLDKYVSSKALNLHGEKYEREMARIRQFKAESKDDEQFKRKLIIRASRCSPEKLERFINALRQCGHTDLAGFLKGMYQND